MRFGGIVLVVLLTLGACSSDPEPKEPKRTASTFFSLTPYQLAHLQHWALGDFEDDWAGAVPKPAAFDELSTARQPHALNEAALEACVGGRA